ncbi:MAG: hypothetical protein ACOCWG_04420 [bacterium]
MNPNRQTTTDFHSVLLTNIKHNLEKMQKQYDKLDDYFEDLFYRFYHTSFKVYFVQDLTEEIYELLKSIHPDPSRGMNKYLDDLISKGTKKKFEYKHNKKWKQETLPLLEAFFHCFYFLKMAIKYGKKLDYAPNTMPSGWAALTHLYNIR